MTGKGDAACGGGTNGPVIRALPYVPAARTRRIHPESVRDVLFVQNVTEYALSKRGATDVAETHEKHRNLLGHEHDSLWGLLRAQDPDAQHVNLSP
jgi:hypothetical protein